MKIRKSIGRFSLIIKGLCFSKALLLGCFALFLAGSNLSLKAQSLLTNGSGGTAINPNSAVNIATLLTVGTGATPLTAATVSISSNFVSGQDELGINGSTSGTDGSITYSYNATSGVLTLTGSVTAADYQATLRKVTYKNTSASPNTSNRTVSFSLNAALPYSGNNHYYEFVSAANPSWTTARDAAASRTYFGLKGYLVTSTSSGENAFIAAKLTGQGWLGASDATEEGVWKWVTGPENGTTFWNGASGGSVVTYANWNSDEPNDSGSNEDYGQFIADGKWNDLPESYTGMAGYVVEYGGTSGDPVLHISDVATVSINYQPADPTSVTANYNVLCNGASTTLTANGAVGTVYWYTASCGGTATSPATGNTLTVSPSATTTYYARNYNNSQYSAGCASISIVVNPRPTVNDLQATGTGIKWYLTPTGGTALLTSTQLIHNTHYYASQTVNGVESTVRFDVLVTMSNP
jgi:hypothetical protein